MAKITLEELGIDKEEMLERTAQVLADKLLHRYEDDGDDGEYPVATDYQKRVEQIVKEKIDDSITKIAAKHVLPRMKKYMEDFCLQETTAWGEAVGDPMTFTEYLVKRAEYYMTEKVDGSGKNKQESSEYHWRGEQTRIAHMVHRHLHYNIGEAMKTILKDANNILVEGIRETIATQLEIVKKKLQVEISTKR